MQLLFRNSFGKPYEETMKLKTTWALFIAIGLISTACSQEKTELETVKEKASYAIGQQISGSLVRVAPEIDEASLIQGIKDTLAKKPPLIDNQAAAEALKEYNEVLQKAATDRVNAEAESNLKAANEFLEKNKLKEGVTVTESGLQYEMLQLGEGANPVETDVVKVHYRGTLLDGTEFDSSLSRGEPATFPLKQVIPGWTEGIQLMKPGAKYMFYLPPALAYGPQGAGNTIGPNSLLIFEVELLGIEAP
jgi:FKBP-type peptidyl-prolyl cis-trans isomerase